MQSEALHPCGRDLKFYLNFVEGGSEIADDEVDFGEADDEGRRDHYGVTAEDRPRHPGRGIDKQITPHRGVEETDPRNRGIIEHFRPPEVTPDYLRARFAKTIPNQTPAQIEALAAKVLAQIASKPHRPPPPLSQSLDQVADPLYGLGTHPDIIERLWRLDKSLPRRCRWVVWGYPALAHPVTGVIFAIGFGTIGIVVRLAPEQRDSALAIRPANPGQNHDISTAGPEWRFLDGQGQAGLCRAAYDFAALPPT